MKKIPGFDYLYATKDGRIYSKKISRYLKLGKNKAFGYLQVHLCKKTYRVNRIIALTFIPNPKNLPCVGHKDNDRTNNHVSNLYWCSYKENTQQCIKDGRLKPKGKPQRSRFVISCIQADYLLGVSRTLIKQRYNVSDFSITMYTKDFRR